VRPNQKPKALGFIFSTSVFSCMKKPLNTPAEASTVERSSAASAPSTIAGHVGGDVEAGLQLIQAKAALEHGLWLKLFKPDGLPFSDRIAQKLICIAKNEYFANSKNYSYLPVRREVAYQLSDLSSEILAAGVRKGKITPKMSIKQAVEFTLENGGVSKRQSR